MLVPRSARRLAALVVVALLGGLLLVHGSTARSSSPSPRLAASAAQASSPATHTRVVPVAAVDDNHGGTSHPDLTGYLPDPVRLRATVTPDLDAAPGTAVVITDATVPSDRAPPAL